MISIVAPTSYDKKIIEFTLPSLTSRLVMPYEIIVSEGGSGIAHSKLLQSAARFTPMRWIPVRMKHTAKDRGR